MSLSEYITKGKTAALNTTRIEGDSKEMGIPSLIHCPGPDPLGIGVLVEDAAAVLGLVVASVCLGLVHVTGVEMWFCSD